MRKFLTCVLLSGLAAGCSLNDDDLKNGWWKACGGEIPEYGDVLKFDGEHFRNDTLYGKTLENKDTVLGYIIKKEKRLFANDAVVYMAWGEQKTARYCRK